MRGTTVESQNHSSSPRSWLAASGALLAALGVAVAAYAAHAVEGAARESLRTAAAMAFGHGIALAALAPTMARALGKIALVMVLSGSLLFSGALLVSHAFGLSPRTAPFGGSLLIFGWLLYAIDAARSRL